MMLNCFISKKKIQYHRNNMVVDGDIFANLRLLLAVSYFLSICCFLFCFFVF
jgi:hypothetical protein